MDLFFLHAVVVGTLINALFHMLNISQNVSHVWKFVRCILGVPDCHSFARQQEGIIYYEDRIPAEVNL